MVSIKYKVAFKLQNVRIDFSFPILYTFVRQAVIFGQEKTIYPCFDNDPAGENYRDKIKQELQPYCLSDKQCKINENLRIRQKKKILG